MPPGESQRLNYPHWRPKRPKKRLERLAVALKRKKMFSRSNLREQLKVREQRLYQEVNRPWPNAE